jgi:HEAT repeat protein
MDKLAHPASLVRASAAMALGDLKVKEAEPRLLEIITDADETSEAQVAAARALINIGNTRGAQVLWQELQRSDLDLNSRLTYALAVGAISDEKIQKEIAEDLRSTKFTKSFTAALMLGVKGDPRARTPLVTALEHGYPHIRRYAILGLENIPDDTSYRVLADTANDDLDAQVRILCAASLVRAGFDDFKVVLWNSLDTRKEDIRSEAIVALGSIADEQILQQLKWYLRREPSIPVRQTIQRVFREQ